MPNSVAVRDFNGDSTADLVIVNEASNSITYWEGVGDGTMTQKGIDPHSYSAGIAPFSVAAADFNGDGTIDLAVAVGGENYILVFPGNGDGTFGDPLTFTVGQSPHFVVAADFDGDGQIDLAVANNESDTISILFNNSR